MGNEKLRRQPCLALIADMVKSRDVPRGQRPRVQARFKQFIDELNKIYSRSLLSKFAITLGDEFQGLLLSSSLIPDLMWDVERRFADRELRVGVGFGTLDTPVQKYAINVDGPALHNARLAIEKAKQHRKLGGVFVGFGEIDEVLNGIARIMWFHRSQFTQQQAKAFDLLRRGLSQSEAAEKLGITRQAISKQVGSSGWNAYTEAEKAWRILLEREVDPMLGIIHENADRRP
jgi:SatD family protein